MTEQSAAAGAATVFEHDSTLVLAVELSGKGWEVGAVLPGVARWPRRSLAPRDMAGLLRQIERWKREAQRAGQPAPGLDPGGVPDGAVLRGRPGRVLDRAVSAGARH
jgi:hypothetical protein